MSDKCTRSRIINAADELFYQQGYDQTSFADIAKAVQISRGNFYYHFKTKDEILQAVIENRLSSLRQMLARWDAELPDPGERIRRYIDSLITNQANIKHFGCPVGTLCSELAKLRHASRAEATALFALFRDWLAAQFRLLGHPAQAETLAMHLIARGQGIATLANAFHDEQFLMQEVAQLHAWLDSIAEPVPSLT
ncbi:MAG: TetR/AcrR family transcriptional regulator [Gammaproteobacteria bacterium]|jgi:TetR/AcrR family transcriptional regulator, transcriptional repressor for nem operon